MLSYPECRMHEFALFGAPRGKGRPRVFKHKQSGKILALTPAETVKYENDLKASAFGALTLVPACMEEYRRESERFAASLWPRTGRYALVVLPFFKDRRRHDLDNVVKIVCDSMNGVLWDDDTQVDEIYTRRGFDSINPRVVVRAWVLS